MTASIYLSRLPAPGKYCELWRKGKEITKAGGIVTLGWAGRDLDAAAFDHEMLRALDGRINVRGGIIERGRKFDSDWQTGCRRDARAINEHFGNRLALRLCNLSTKELRRRYAGRIPADYSDE